MSNKKGSVLDVFIYLAIAFIVVIISGIFIFVQSEVSDQLHATLDNKSTEAVNYTSALVSFDAVETGFAVLNWATLFIFVGLAIAIFISAYFVNVNPIFIIVYIFILAFLILFSAIISNAYESIRVTPSLVNAFSGMVGTNFLISYLPVWITAVGFIGAIILFARFKRGEGSI